MEKLSKEEVLHVAELGRLELSDDEIEKFSYQLKKLFDEIDKINEIELNCDKIMFSPSTNDCKLFEDESVSFDGVSNLIDNAPKKFDNFIEVAGVFDE